MVEDKIQYYMKTLKCTRAEAVQLANDDKEIESGIDLFPLTKEQAKVAKAMSQADREKETRKRERKINPNRVEIFQALDEALCDIADDVKVLTPNRELVCVYNDIKFKITLSCPRN